MFSFTDEAMALDTPEVRPSSWLTAAGIVLLIGTIIQEVAGFSL
jgi:hypothetical protein